MIDIDGRHLRAAAREFILEKWPAVAAFDDEHAAARRVFETRVPEQAFRVECSARRQHRDAIARMVERTSRRGTDGGQSQIALLIEQ